MKTFKEFTNESIDLHKVNNLYFKVKNKKKSFKDEEKAIKFLKNVIANTPEFKQQANTILYEGYDTHTHDDLDIESNDINIDLDNLTNDTIHDWTNNMDKLFQIITK